MQTSMLHWIMLGAFLASAAADTPLEQVTSLLKDLKKKIDSEGAAEAKAYAKFACFCKDATESKSKSITKGQDFIDTTTADIGKLTATKEDKTEKRLQQKRKVETVTQKLKEATDAYMKDKAAHEANHADLSKAVGSTRRAIKTLRGAGGKGTSLLDLGSKSDIRNVLDLADALGLVQPKKQQAVATLLQRVDPKDPEYQFHSGKIMEIVGDLEKDFTKKRDDAQTEWTKTDSSFQSEKKSMQDSIATAQKAIKMLTGDINKLQAHISSKKQDLLNAESLLQDDSKYLLDLTRRCQQKGRDWDQRSKMRNDEGKSITSALKILTGTVKKAEKVNVRASLLNKKAPIAPARVVVNKAPKQANVKIHTEVKPKAKSLMELGEKTQGFLSKTASYSEKVQDRMIEFLSREGKRLNSATLSSLAGQIQADPFRKIKKLIQGLVERLLDESAQEATKKGFCDTELAKSYETRDSQQAAANKLDSELSELEAREDVLNTEISELTDASKELKAELKEATEQRKTSKAQNEQTLKTAEEGLVATEESLVLLRDFYKKAAKAASLLQVSASPVDEDEKNPGSGFDGVYKGSQDSSRAILGLLETIKSDFERTFRTTEADEAADLKEFVKFERVSEADISGKDTKIELDKEDLESTEQAIEDSLEDMTTAQNLLDGALKNIESLKPTCIDTGMSNKERVQKREEEIGALREALCMLGDAGPDCKSLK